MPTAPPTHRPFGHIPRTVRPRASARSRGYDGEWEALRRRIIAAHPRCSAPGCGSTDRLNVDHVQSVRDAPHRRLDPTNLRVLCQSCHSARTSRDHSWNRR